MRRALILISALLAAAGLGALAASGFAGGEPGTEEIEIDAERELGALAVQRVAAPAAAATGLARGKGNDGSEQLTFFQTPEPLEIAAHSEEGATLSCPKGYKAMGGYYVTGREGTFLGLTAPEVAMPPESGSPDARPSKRNWVIAVYNATDAPDQVDFGVACLRKRT
jgi:hypothetical protein